MRVGLFGGSFDPPHRGHLAVAEAVRDSFALDRVLLAPAAIQPLKPGGAHASFADRLHMVELLCDGAHGIAASTIDGPLDGPQAGSPNYTIDTLGRLRGQLPPGAEIFVIVGADAFLGIRQWKDPEALIKQARWIIVSRPGFDLHQLKALQLTPEQRARIQTLSDFANPVSATEIRERLRKRETGGLPGQLPGRDDDPVPPKVLEYIRAHHLYGT
ncbi:MAG TPA: nicotinate (nicotinamide) nucleotide adenylyltransferase [Acidobacteriaceae bacterium]|nr:nicotinate (nicotinamide) nucleotide adenylyltransferase [Acidobacteriaceae bacterium]